MKFFAVILPEVAWLSELENQARFIRINMLHDVGFPLRK
jgi:hypothetical protein